MAATSSPQQDKDRCTEGPAILRPATGEAAREDARERRMHTMLDSNGTRHLSQLPNRSDQSSTQYRLEDHIPGAPTQGLMSDEQQRGPSAPRLPAEPAAPRRPKRAPPLLPISIPHGLLPVPIPAAAAGPLLPPTILPAVCQLLLVYIHRATLMAALHMPGTAAAAGGPTPSPPSQTPPPPLPSPQPTQDASKPQQQQSQQPTQAEQNQSKAGSSNQGPQQQPSPLQHIPAAEAQAAAAAGSGGTDPPPVVAVRQLKFFDIPVPLLLQAAAHLMVVGAVQPAHFKAVQDELLPQGMPLPPPIMQTPPSATKAAAPPGAPFAPPPLSPAAPATQAEASPAATEAAAAGFLAPGTGTGSAAEAAAADTSDAADRGAASDTAPPPPLDGRAAGHQPGPGPGAASAKDAAQGQPTSASTHAPVSVWGGRGAGPSPHRLGLGRRLFSAVADQLPKSTELDSILPPLYGYSGVLYKIHGTHDIGAALWDGSVLRDLGPYTSAIDARQSVNVSIRLLAAGAALSPLDRNQAAAKGPGAHGGSKEGSAANGGGGGASQEPVPEPDVAEVAEQLLMLRNPFSPAAAKRPAAVPRPPGRQDTVPWQPKQQPQPQSQGAMGAREAGQQQQQQPSRSRQPPPSPQPPPGPPLGPQQQQQRTPPMAAAQTGVAVPSAAGAGPVVAGTSTSGNLSPSSSVAPAGDGDPWVGRGAVAAMGPAADAAADAAGRGAAQAAAAAVLHAASLPAELQRAGSQAATAAATAAEPGQVAAASQQPQGSASRAVPRAPEAANGQTVSAQAAAPSKPPPPQQQQPSPLVAAAGTQRRENRLLPPPSLSPVATAGQIAAGTAGGGGGGTAGPTSASLGERGLAIAMAVAAAAQAALAAAPPPPSPPAAKRRRQAATATAEAARSAQPPAPQAPTPCSAPAPCPMPEAGDARGAAAAPAGPAAARPPTAPPVAIVAAADTAAAATPAAAIDDDGAAGGASAQGPGNGGGLETSEGGPSLRDTQLLLELLARRRAIHLDPTQLARLLDSPDGTAALLALLQHMPHGDGDGEKERGAAEPGRRAAAVNRGPGEAAAAAPVVPPVARLQPGGFEEADGRRVVRSAPAATVTMMTTRRSLPPQHPHPHQQQQQYRYQHQQQQQQQQQHQPQQQQQQRHLLRAPPSPHTTSEGPHASELPPTFEQSHQHQHPQRALVLDNGRYFLLREDEPSGGGSQAALILSAEGADEEVGGGGTKRRGPSHQHQQQQQQQKNVLDWGVAGGEPRRGGGGGAVLMLEDPADSAAGGRAFEQRARGGGGQQPIQWPAALRAGGGGGASASRMQAPGRLMFMSEDLPPRQHEEHEVEGQGTGQLWVVEDEFGVRRLVPAAAATGTGASGRHDLGGGVRLLSPLQGGGYGGGYDEVSVHASVGAMRAAPIELVYQQRRQQRQRDSGGATSGGGGGAVHSSTTSMPSAAATAGAPQPSSRGALVLTSPSRETGGNGGGGGGASRYAASGGGGADPRLLMRRYRLSLAGPAAAASDGAGASYGHAALDVSMTPPSVSPSAAGTTLYGSGGGNDGGHGGRLLVGRGEPQLSLRGYSQYGTSVGGNGGGRRSPGGEPSVVAGSGGGGGFSSRSASARYCVGAAAAAQQQQMNGTLPSYGANYAGFGASLDERSRLSLVKPAPEVSVEESDGGGGSAAGPPHRAAIFATVAAAEGAVASHSGESGGGGGRRRRDAVSGAATVGEVAVGELPPDAKRYRQAPPPGLAVEVSREYSAVTNLMGLGLQEALAIVRQREGPPL